LIYIFHKDAGDKTLNIKGEVHKYLVKVRRHDIGDKIDFRSQENLKTLHTYEIKFLESRSVFLELISSTEHEVKAYKPLHIGWCVIDAKSAEKVLPSLCEIGVEKITFIYCDRSQKNFKADFKRFDRIQEASMQQSGRSSFIELDTCKNIQTFIKTYPDTKVFDFCENILEDGSDFQTVLIGCEGGFSQNERELLNKQDNFRLNSPMVLRSESAVLAVASKIIL